MSYPSSLNDQAERLGIKGTQFGGRATQMGGGDYRSEDDVEKDVLAASNNDYDNRKFLEIVGDDDFKEKMKEEGTWNKDINKAYKVAQSGNGIVSMDDLAKVQTGFAELGNVLDTHNNRGEFDVRDQAGTLNAALAEYMDMFSLKDAVTKNNKKKDKDKDDEPETYTETEMENLGNVIDSVHSFESGRRTGPTESFDTRDDEQKRSSMEFANDFKKSIIGRGRQSRFAI